MKVVEGGGAAEEICGPVYFVLVMRGVCEKGFHIFPQNISDLAAQILQAEYRLPVAALIGEDFAKY